MRKYERKCDPPYHARSSCTPTRIRYVLLQSCSQSTLPCFSHLFVAFSFSGLVYMPCTFNSLTLHRLVHQRATMSIKPNSATIPWFVSPFTRNWPDLVSALGRLNLRSKCGVGPDENLMKNAELALFPWIFFDFLRTAKFSSGKTEKKLEDIGEGW